MAKLILGNRQMSIIIIIHAALMSAEKLSFLQWRMMAEAQRIAFITTQSSGCPLKILFFADHGPPEQLNDVLWTPEHPARARMRVLGLTPVERVFRSDLRHRQGTADG